MKSFISILDTIGKDVEHGLEKLLPVAEAAAPVVALAVPEIGPIFATTVGVVAQTEQKFAAIGKSSGTGQQKLQDATAVLAPVLQHYFAQAGKKADVATIQNYISAVVNMLNAIPALEQK